MGLGFKIQVCSRYLKKNGVSVFRALLFGELAGSIALSKFYADNAWSLTFFNLQLLA